MLKRILAGVVLSLMLTGAAAAGPYEEGVAAYQRGDYATALRLWRPLAEQGDARAQFCPSSKYLRPLSIFNKRDSGSSLVSI